MLNSLAKNWLRMLLLSMMPAVLVACAQAGTIEHEIQVRGADTSAPVSDVAIRAEIGTRDFVETVSDAAGLAQFAFDEKYEDRWAKVILEAEGYERKSILVKLVSADPVSIVQLEPVGQATAGNQPAAEERAAVESSSPAAEAITEAVASEETVPPGPLADVPPAQRANYYQAKPDLTINTGKVYRATIKTGKGDIVVSLDARAAPEHVNNFIFLSNQGFYDGLTFHRVEPGFVIQGGDPEGSGQGGPGYTIPGEFGLTHIEGALAMARLPDQVNPNRESSGSQFYITLAPTPFLDGQYSVFGKVEAGMEVVQSIQVGDVIERIIVEP